MSYYRLIQRGDVLPASFLAALQEFISTGAFGLKLDLANATTVKVAAGAASAQVGVGIDGLWRYRSADVTAAVSGPAGTKDVFVVASANSFSETPSPDTDNTDYTFGLQVLASGSTPTGNYNGNAITAFRKIGEIEWDGSANVTALRQTVGLKDATSVATPTAPTPAVTPLNVVGATAQSAPLIRARVGAGADAFSVDASGNVNATGQYRIAGSQISAANLSNGTTGSGAVALATSPTFSGVAAAPTPAVDTNTTQLATTAFVIGQASAAGDGTPPMNGTAARGSSTHFARADHVHPSDTSRAPLASPSFTGSMTLTPPDASDASAAFAMQPTGDAVARFTVQRSGKLRWGGGSGAMDLSLYRNSSGWLTTDASTVYGIGSDFTSENHSTIDATYAAAGFGTGGLWAVNPDASGGTGARGLSISVSQDIVSRFEVLFDGTLRWGPGNASVDTNLYRGPAGGLKTDGAFSAGTNLSLLGSSSTILFGPSSDVNLYRSTTDTLKTDDTLIVATKLGVGAPTFTTNYILDARGAGTTPALGRVLSAASGQLAGVGAGRTAVDIVMGVAGATSDWFTGSASGDGVLQTPNNGAIWIGPAAGAKLRINSTGVGFHGVAPVARPAARTMTNWSSGTNAVRSIDRNNFTLQSLFDFVMTMAFDHQQNGLFA